MRILKEQGPSYLIRSLEERDLASLMALYHAIIDEEAYRRAPGEYADDDLKSLAERTARILENPNNAFLVATSEAEGKESVIGFLRFLQNTSRRRTRHGGSFTIGVHQRFRSRGVGQALLEALLSKLEQTEIERVSLQVFSDNHVVRRFYEKNGFVASGTLPGEVKLEDGRYRDLVLMHRWIR